MCQSTGQEMLGRGSTNCGNSSAKGKSAACTAYVHTTRDADAVLSAACHGAYPAAGVHTAPSYVNMPQQSSPCVLFRVLSFLPPLAEQDTQHADLGSLDRLV